MIFYLLEKAEDFLEKGYLLYRNQDFFQLPPVDLTTQEHQALYDICEQIMEQRGMFSYAPLTGTLAEIQLFFESMHCVVLEYTEETITVQHALSTHLQEKLYCLFTDTTPTARTQSHFSSFKPSIAAPSYPFVSYQPILLRSDLVQSGRIQDCWYQLHVNCKTDSVIQYQSILFCIDPARALPCFLVTEEIGIDCVFLCYFDAAGHHNQGPCSFESTDEFFQKALTIVDNFLTQTTPEWVILGGP